MHQSAGLGQLSDINLPRHLRIRPSCPPEEILPELWRSLRDMCVLAVRQCFASRVTGDIGENETGRIGKQLRDDPFQVLLRAMLENVGRDHAVVSTLRQGAMGWKAGIVAMDGIDAEVTLHRRHPADAGQLYITPFVLPALTASVIQDGPGARALDERSNAPRLRRKAGALEKAIGGDAVGDVACDMQPLIHLDQLPVARRGIAARRALLGYNGRHAWTGRLALPRLEAGTKSFPQARKGRPPPLALILPVYLEPRKPR